MNEIDFSKTFYDHSEYITRSLSACANKLAWEIGRVFIPFGLMSKVSKLTAASSVLSPGTIHFRHVDPTPPMKRALQAPPLISQRKNHFPPQFLAQSWNCARKESVSARVLLIFNANRYTFSSGLVPY